MSGSAISFQLDSGTTCSRIMRDHQARKELPSSVQEIDFPNRCISYIKSLSSGAKFRAKVPVFVGIALLQVAGPTTYAYPANARASENPDIVTKNELSTLFRVKTELDRFNRTYLWHCVLIPSDTDSGDTYNGGCTNIGPFAQYANGVGNKILLEPIIEFFPQAFFVLFSPDDYYLLKKEESREVLTISDKCSVFRVDVLNPPPMFILHIKGSIDKKEIDTCLFAGFLSYMSIPIRTNQLSNPLGYYKFVYNFIASEEHELEEIVRDALGRTEVESESVKIEE